MSAVEIIGALVVGAVMGVSGVALWLEERQKHWPNPENWPGLTRSGWK